MTLKCETTNLTLGKKEGTGRDFIEREIGRDVTQSEKDKNENAPLRVC